MPVFIPYSLSRFLLKRLPFLLSVLGFFVFILDFAFNQETISQYLIDWVYDIVLIYGIMALIIRYVFQKKKPIAKVLFFDLVSTFLIAWVLLANFTSDSFLTFFDLDDNGVKFAIIITIIREFSEQNINFKRTVFNPAQLFILSFFVIIIIGALLLMTPNATTHGIGFLDALFTSTSAVCVTGLTVVDTASAFTLFGQSIILSLIQIGGLGILTFASYFSYFFMGGSSYENQLVLKDMVSAEKLGGVFDSLKQVLIITFIIEFIGAILIYFSVNHNAYFTSIFDQIYFSIFHSISAFCNAGFSTLPMNLFQSEFRDHYFFFTNISLIIILGSLGFPIVVNSLNYLRYVFVKNFLNTQVDRVHIPWVLNINSRITLITSLSLTFIGFLVFFLDEYHNTLAEHTTLLGKTAVALFNSAVPRTAGFNNVDMASLHFSSIMFIILLMWIGASPASTGGGITTSTFAIATLNFISLARGKTRIEVYRREIADISVRRAFATISLSLVSIGGGIMGIALIEEDGNLLDIAFECFSAYSTVGLSLGITPSLSQGSKLILIGLMFTGRVTMLSILIAIFDKVKHHKYRYPSEEITIN